MKVHQYEGTPIFCQLGEPIAINPAQITIPWLYWEISDGKNTIPLPDSGNEPRNSSTAVALATTRPTAVWGNWTTSSVIERYIRQVLAWCYHKLWYSAHDWPALMYRSTMYLLPFQMTKLQLRDCQAADGENVGDYIFDPTFDKGRKNKVTSMRPECSTIAQ